MVASFQPSIPHAAGQPDALALLGRSLSQVQRAPTFWSMSFAVPLRGERLGLDAVLFLMALMPRLRVGRRMPVAPGRCQPLFMTTTKTTR